MTCPSIPHPWIRKLNMVKMAILPKLIYRFNINPIKILAAFLFFFFVEVKKLIIKFIRKCKETRIAKIVLKEKNKVGGLILLISKLTTKLDPHLSPYKN